MCGSRKIERRVITVKYRDGVQVPNVAAEVCANCGETYFDLAAMERLEALDGRSRRRRPRSRA